MQCIPKVGDMVWVEFEYGDTRKPIWSYGHFSTSNGTEEKPKELKDVNNFWFKTPGGHLVEFDDTNEWIKITSKQGKVVSIKDTINLGSNDAKEQMALGNTLVTTLSNICDIINSMSNSIQAITVPTPMGVSGVPINDPDFVAISQGILDIQGNLDTILSTVSKTD